MLQENDLISRTAFICVESKISGLSTCFKCLKPYFYSNSSSKIHFKGKHKWCLDYPPFWIMHTTASISAGN